MNALSPDSASFLPAPGWGTVLSFPQMQSKRPIPKNHPSWSFILEEEATWQEAQQPPPLPSANADSLVLISCLSR